MISFLVNIGLILELVVVTTSFKGRIPIGAIFDEDDEQIKTGVRYALTIYNDRLAKDKFTLSATEEDIDVEDSYKLTTAICKHMFGGVFILLGSRSFKSHDTIKSVTQKFQMPFVTTSVPHDVTGYDGYEIFMKPPVTHALKAMIRHYGYKDLHYVYDTDAGLLRLEKLKQSLKATNDTRDVIVRMYKIQNISMAHDELKILDRLYQRKKIKSILMDFSSEATYSIVLDQVREVGMNKHGYTYILGTMNILNLDLYRFTHGGVNITGFQLVDYTAENVEKFIYKWKNLPKNIWIGAGRERISVDTALAVDAVQIVESTIKDMLRNDSEVFRTTFRRGDVYNNNKTKGIPCHRGIPWMHGETIIRNIKKTKHNGLTGILNFTENGIRKDYKLDVFKTGLNFGPNKIGTWNPDDGFVENSTESDANLSSIHDPKIVTSILERPFLMENDELTNEDGKPGQREKYKGFCATLTKLLADRVGFTYIIQPNKDGVYGTKDPEGNGSVNTWNGMIGS